ncbi:STAS domain-containing protein [Streptomyces sp. NPDC127168]|uniref:STAS domain-containing protein n=1 Tax=unclassified Streptomyces TaxID=2593676 RepID=UPI0036455119
MSVDGAVTGCQRGTREDRLQVREQARVVQYERCGARVVSARGAYDMDTITPLAEALYTASTAHPKVVLDASGITFADSTVLSLLIRTHQAADLRIAAPAQQLRRLLQLTGADALLKVTSTVDEAATV